MIAITNNRYDGVIADPATLPGSKEEFEKEMVQLIGNLQHKKLLWINIPIEKSDFIPVLAKHDFEFHHCDERNLMLVKKLSRDAVMPAAKNYRVGVGAVVLHEGRLLVIRDKFSGGYKLPGGHIEKNESLKDAVKREVYEETGISIEFESIMNIGHFRHGQLDGSDLYLVCTAKALSEEITVHDASEIVEARWLDPEEFLQSADVYPYNKSVVRAAISNKELKLTERQIQLRVRDGEVFF